MNSRTPFKYSSIGYIYLITKQGEVSDFALTMCLKVFFQKEFQLHKYSFLNKILKPATHLATRSSQRSSLPHLFSVYYHTKIIRDMENRERLVCEQELYTVKTEHKDHLGHCRLTLGPPSSVKACHLLGARFVSM